MALRQEIASQAVGNLAGIDRVVLLFGRRDGPQHQRMSHLNRAGVRQQMVINPAAEDRRLHGDGRRLWQGFDPRVQLAPGRPDPAFLMHTTSCVLHAVADRLLRNKLIDPKMQLA